MSRINIYTIARKFEELRTVKDAPKSSKPKTSRSDENFSVLQDNKFIPEIRRSSIDMNNGWLIQNGTTPQTAIKVLSALYETFYE